MRATHRDLFRIIKLHQNEEVDDFPFHEPPVELPENEGLATDNTDDSAEANGGATQALPGDADAPNRSVRIRQATNTADHREPLIRKHGIPDLFRSCEIRPIREKYH